MRLDGWEIDAFGPISGWTEHGLAEHDVIVVAGDNETGKSALFEFLTTALFGFAPAAAANHPYRPWDGRFPGGALLANLGDGRSVRIARRLTSRPQGTIEIDGQPHDLANRPVTWIGGLARAVFTNLHAVTQNEALGMDSRTWQSVEDRMLGGSSFDFLRPAREVVQQLHQDRQNLWRPDRRGRPKAVEIRERVRELREDLRPATGRRDQIETAQARLEELADRLQVIERGPEGLHAIEVMLERDATLAPIVRRAHRAADLDAEAESLVANDDFGPDPGAERAELRQTVAACAQRIEEIEREIEQAGEVLDLDPATRAVLAARTAIEELRSQIPLHDEDEKRIEQMSRALQRERGRFDQLAERVLDAPLDTEGLATLRALRLAEARGRYEDWSAADADFDRRAADRRHAAETAERAQREREALGDVADWAAADARVQTLRELDRAEARAGAASRAPSPLWRALAPVLVALAGVAAIIVGVVVRDAILAGVGASVAAGAAVWLAMTVTARRRAGMGSAAAAALRGRAGLAPDVSAAQALDEAMRQRDTARRAADIEQRLAAAKVLVEDAAHREGRGQAGRRRGARCLARAASRRFDCARAPGARPRDAAARCRATARPAVAHACAARRTADSCGSALTSAWAACAACVTRWGSTRLPMQCKRWRENWAGSWTPQRRPRAIPRPRRRRSPSCVKSGSRRVTHGTPPTPSLGSWRRGWRSWMPRAPTRTWVSNGWSGRAPHGMRPGARGTTLTARRPIGAIAWPRPIGWWRRERPSSFRTTAVSSCGAVVRCWRTRPRDLSKSEAAWCATWQPWKRRRAPRTCKAPSSRHRLSWRTSTERTTGWRCWRQRSPPLSGPTATNINRRCWGRRAATWPASPTGATTG